MKTRQLKTYGLQQKQFLDESLQQYNPTSRNKKKKIDNPTLHLKQLKNEEEEEQKLVEGKKS